LAALRTTAPTAHIPVIIVSIVDQKRIGFALGAADYLVKPIQKPILLETLRRHLHSHKDTGGPILLVDDDRKNLELMESALRPAGYETQSVETGALALDVISTQPVSAILLDLLMPGMDGFEVIQQVRGKYASQDLPILVMTAKDLTHEERCLLSRETQGVFQKQGSWQEQLAAELGRAIYRPVPRNGASNPP
jgi:CheY-like chemotaxis protein